MKQSQYNHMVKIYDISNSNIILYNTLHRKYIVITENEKEIINNLYNNLNKKLFTKQEVSYIKKLSNIGAIIPNNFDELSYLRVLYNKNKFNNNKLILVLNPTLSCNFRCTYCYEKHNNIVFNNDTIRMIINFVKNKAKEINELSVAWFGGEPLLEFDKICYLSNEFIKICKKNQCKYTSSITTNGYLLDDNKIYQLSRFNVNNIQITLDGPKDFHNKTRKLVDGTGTYSRIRNNIIKLAKNGIGCTLRVNVTQNNYKHISELFDDIPIQYRRNIRINMSNIFQDKNTINLYELYKNSIIKGFRYDDKLNSLVKCEGGTPNAITIYPNGKLSFCSMAAEEELFYGELKNNDVKITNKGLFYKFNNISVFDDSSCIKCKLLPMCMGSCMLARFKDKNKCTKKRGLSLDEKIKLHYLSDLSEKN